MDYIKSFDDYANESVNYTFILENVKPDDNAEPGKPEDAHSSREKKLSDEIEKLHTELVPSQGAADTVEGEMVRAVMRVWYRYYNDGDFYFRGYGKETVQPSVTWLRRCPLGKELGKILTSMKNSAPRGISQGTGIHRYTKYIGQYGPNDGYLKGILDMAEAVINYVKSKNGNYTKNEGQDSR